MNVRPARSGARQGHADAPPPAGVYERVVMRENAARGDDVTAVVLVRPREEGNVGAAARAMANMGLRRLILVEPAADLGPTARAFAVGAREVLDECLRVGSLREALAPFSRVVGTTSTRDRRQAVALIGPRELPECLASDPPGTPVALVFGPEVGGLTNQELALANLVVTIPCAPRQPTLNLAQAVLILAYELYQPARDSSGRGRMAITGHAAAAASKECRDWRQAEPRPAGGRRSRGQAEARGPLMPGAADAPATSAEVDGLFDHAAAVLGRIGFERDSTFSGVLRDLRAAAARARLSSRETAILRGICRRALHALAVLPTQPGNPPA